jgi:hypothetical protein
MARKAKKVVRKRASPPVSFEITKTTNGFLCKNYLKNRNTNFSVHESPESLIEAISKYIPKLVDKAGGYYDYD